MSVRSALVQQLVAAICALSFCACSTISRVPVDNDALIKTRSASGPGHDSRLQAAVTQTDTGFDVAVTRTDTCTVHVERLMHRTRTVHKRIEGKAALVLEFGVGAAMLIAGSIVTYDAPSVPMPDDPVESNPIGRTGAYGIGGSLLTIGAAGIVMGIVDLRRARDSTEDGGTFTQAANDPPHDVRCNEGPSATTELKLRAKATGSDNFDDVVVGVTDASGKLLVPWSSVPRSWLDSAGWVRSLAIVAGDSALLEVALDRGRALVAEETWTKTKATNAPAGYRAYLERFPEAHHDEAVASFRTTRVPELEADFAAALAAKDVKRVEAVVEEWAAVDADSSKLGVVSAQARELKLDDLLAQTDKLLSSATKDRVGELTAAQADLEQAASIGKQDDARISKRTKRLAQIRLQIVSVFIAEVRSKATKDDFDGARASLARATELDHDSHAVEIVRADVERLEKASLERAERKRIAEEKTQQRRQDCALSCLNQTPYEAKCASDYAGLRGGADLGYALCTKGYRCACASQCGMKTDPIYGYSCP